MKAAPRAADLWDGLSAAEIARLTGTSRVVLFEEVESTQDIAHELAEGGDAPGALVLANAQRAGRGRMGRSWTSEPGSGVWCTLLAAPDVDPQGLDVLTIRIGLRMARELDAIAGERVGLKWPNDLVLRAGKVGGILVETRIGGVSTGCMAIGVGINVVAPRHVTAAAGLPAGTRRVDVLRAIVRSVGNAVAANGHLTPAELKDYRRRDTLIGRRLLSPWPGTARGIEDTGCLMIETPAGMECRRAGTVQFAEDA